MNILMFTNNYLPHIGGVARSVFSFATAFRTKNHRTIIVAPADINASPVEDDVIRTPSIQGASTQHLPVSLPIPGYLNSALATYQADIVHSHHPFILGDTALRYAAQHNLPIVFTYHTMYEQYIHYVGTESPTIRQLVQELVSAYCNLCDHLIAPTSSIAKILRERNINAPISIVPTGIDETFFVKGNPAEFRKKVGIPADAFVIGYIGRLAQEKNLPFLAQAAAKFLQNHTSAHLLIVGEGKQQSVMAKVLESYNVADRSHLIGSCTGQQLIDAFQALDVFIFSSLTETQGIVLLEAMAARRPVVALDAAGTRDIIRDTINGRLVKEQKIENFLESLDWITKLNHLTSQSMRQSAFDTAQQYSINKTAQSVLDIYAALIKNKPLSKKTQHDHKNTWEAAWRRFNVEVELTTARARGIGNALQRQKKLDNQVGW